jgi:hypothetical protein
MNTVTDSLPEPLKPLQTEIATYEAELPRLLSAGEGGRFAVIKGDDVLGTWDTYRDALEYGYDRFGDQPFMVQLIDKRDVVRFAQFRANQEAACRS